MRLPIKIIVAGYALALSLVGAAMAGPLEDGQAAYDRGDYATAMRLLRPLAEQGNKLTELSEVSKSNDQGAYAVRVPDFPTMTSRHAKVRLLGGRPPCERF